MTAHLSAAHRREQIVAAARALSSGGNLYTWSLTDVAEYVGVSRSAVRWYFTLTDLRAHIIETAIDEADAAIVMQAIATHDPLVADIPDSLRKACARELTR